MLLEDLYRKHTTSTLLAVVLACICEVCEEENKGYLKKNENPQFFCTKQGKRMN
jgi:hypothetical protein